MISIIIPAYNEEAYIGDCLQSFVQQQTDEEFEVIVVDNASTDRTTDVANTFKDKLNLQEILMRVHLLIWGHFWLNGFSAATWKSVYEEAGGFNTHADAQEDTELSRHIRRLGVIKLLRKPRMIVSGRRFKEKGILFGLWEYLSSFIAVRLSRGKKRADLSDVR